MKVTIFQRELGRKFSSQEYTKLKKEKSDFLLLPQRSLFLPSSNPSEAVSDYSSHLNELLDASVHYSGVLIGGTLFRKSEIGIHESVPIIKDVSLIDHYDLKTSSISPVQPGSSETVFIMAGVRFSILVGNDILNETYTREISDKDIRILFYLDSEPSQRTYEEDLEFFSELSRNRNWNVFRVCGYKEEFGIPGRSLLSTPSGIQWKVGKSEEYKDILKTIHFAHSSPF